MRAAVACITPILFLAGMGWPALGAGEGQSEPLSACRKIETMVLEIERGSKADDFGSLSSSLSFDEHVLPPVSAFKANDEGQPDYAALQIWLREHQAFTPRQRQRLKAAMSPGGLLKNRDQAVYFLETDDPLLVFENHFGRENCQEFLAFRIDPDGMAQRYFGMPSGSGLTLPASCRSFRTQVLQFEGQPGFYTRQDLPGRLGGTFHFPAKQPFPAESCGFTIEFTNRYRGEVLFCAVARCDHLKDAVTTVIEAHGDLESLAESIPPLDQGAADVMAAKAALSRFYEPQLRSDREIEQSGDRSLSGFEVIDTLRTPRSRPGRDSIVLLVKEETRRPVKVLNQVRFAVSSTDRLFVYDPKRGENLLEGGTGFPGMTLKSGNPFRDIGGRSFDVKAMMATTAGGETYLTQFGLVRTGTGPVDGYGARVYSISESGIDTAAVVLVHRENDKVSNVAFTE